MTFFKFCTPVHPHLSLAPLQHVAWQTFPVMLDDRSLRTGKEAKNRLVWVTIDFWFPASEITESIKQHSSSGPCWAAPYLKTLGGKSAK